MRKCGALLTLSRFGEANVFVRCPVIGMFQPKWLTTIYGKANFGITRAVRKGHIGVVALVSRSARSLLYPRNLPIMLY
jgi:hypothetical protein